MAPLPPPRTPPPKSAILQPSPPRLAVNIVATDETIVLTVQYPERCLPQHWTVGRATDCAVRVTDSWVSAHHLVIRAEPMEGCHSCDIDGDQRYLWLFQDSHSTNGTFQGGVMVGRGGHPSPWIVIEGDDDVFLGRSRLRFSFDGRFTQPGGDTDSGYVAQEVIVPSDIKPPVATQMSPEPSKTPTPSTPWELAALVLTGPKDISNWLWWLYLATIGTILVLGIEWIKKQ